MPNVRVKRQEDAEQQITLINLDEINPIESQDSKSQGLDREKRKLPEATFAGKNAVLGFVFGKIDSVLDKKIRFLNQLDKTNVQKNAQYNIVVPKPINNLQGLITAVVSPKIQGIGSLVSDLTTGVLGGLTSLSGSSSGGGNGNAGLGNVVSKVIGLSGPLLSGSSGGSTTEAPGTSDESGY
ncbi:uncharacterized protein LOC129613253 [Condylostylus longicornis]|uniref:uncharacterized protein LOC129613253 n=1 Tax=Condylostylus longicornis TaxID=2530218 RepID=UPI00244E2AFE|nr:uncharacterized protein LOC129613253 [Condylostylus longicornis]